MSSRHLSFVLQTKSTRSSSRAFTLVELMVVIGIIVVTAGLLGLGLRGGSPTMGLESAQGTVASLLSAVRGEAALHNSRAALMVYASNDGSGKYLNAVAIARETDAGWQRTADFISLPVGIYVVPKGSAIGNGGSTALAATPVSIEGIEAFLLVYSPVGVPENSGKVVFGHAQLPSGVGVDEATDQHDVRGLLLSAYGAIVFVNDSDGFQ